MPREILAQLPVANNLGNMKQSTVSFQSKVKSGLVEALVGVLSLAEFCLEGSCPPYTHQARNRDSSSSMRHQASP